MASGELKRAFKLFRAHKYSEVVRLLEPQIFRYRESYPFYYILGISCLYLGDFGGAFSYLQRANQLKHNVDNVLLGLAVVYLKRGDLENAIKIWLKILDRNPRSKKANAGISFVRRIIANREEFDFESSRDVRKLYPPVPVGKKRFIIPLAFIVVIALITTGYLMFKNQMIDLDSIVSILKIAKKPSRPGIEYVSIDNNNGSLTLFSKGYTYRFTDREIKRIFDRAKKYLLKYRDNLAMIEINKILLSNATAYVKQKASLLKTFVRKPDFSTIRDSIPYRTVVKHPLLYNGCFVRWKGKVANLLITEKSIRFDLLVGYENERELQGIVRVYLDFPVLLENGIPIEVLGKVIADKQSIKLEGISIHKLIK